MSLEHVDLRSAEILVNMNESSTEALVSSMLATMTTTKTTMFTGSEGAQPSVWDSSWPPVKVMEKIGRKTLIARLFSRKRQDFVHNFLTFRGANSQYFLLSRRHVDISSTTMP